MRALMRAALMIMRAAPPRSGEHAGHGGDRGDAAKAMSDLAEARRILSAKS